MTTDRERDAAVDRLLGAALRTPANAPGACPPADELAAFVEGTLSAAERDAFERHAAICARCHQALAVIGSTEPLADTRRERRAWLAWPALRWVVPAAAILATAALLYVAVQPPATVPQKTAEMAQATAVPAGAGGGGEHAAVDTRVAARLKASTPAAAPAEVLSRDESRERTADTPVMSRRIQPEPPVLAAESRTAPKGEAAQNQAVPPTAGVVGGVSAPPGRGIVAAPLVQALPAAPPPPTAADQAQKALVDAVQFKARVAEQPQAQVVARPAAAAPVAPGAFRLAESVVIAAPVVVASPDGSTRWRVESGSRIARSRDGGKTWEVQAFRASTDLLAGSAPSPDVCWLVGRNGLVLLTTDAEHWDVRPFPERADVMAIESRDAKNATVTTLDRRRFVTEDGGATWTIR